MEKRRVIDLTDPSNAPDQKRAGIDAEDTKPSGPGFCIWMFDMHRSHSVFGKP